MGASEAVPGTGERLLRLEGVTRRFPGTVPVTAVSGVDMTVDRGDFVCLVGPSGSGKSTLLNIIGLLDRPTEGGYWLLGENTAEMSRRALESTRANHIGFVFQAFHLIGYRTAVENVMLPFLYRTRRPREARRRSAQALDRVGLSARAGFLPSSLSGGERQRVAIARAIVARPAVLICDEPTGNLDSDTSGVVLDVLSDLNEEGNTVIVATHDRLIADRAGRVFEVRDGLLTDAGGDASS